MTPFWRFKVFLAWKPTNETYPWKGHFLSPMRKKLYHNWNYLFYKKKLLNWGETWKCYIQLPHPLHLELILHGLSVKQHPGKEFFQSEIFWFLDILSVIFSLNSWVDGLPGWCRAEQVNDRVAVHHHCGPGHEEGGLPLTVKRYSSPHCSHSPCPAPWPAACPAPAPSCLWPQTGPSSWLGLKECLQKLDLYIWILCHKVHRFYRFIS